MPGQTGSAQIHAQARPDLCWQAAGNGSPVTLEHCGSAEGQQWTLAAMGADDGADERQRLLPAGGPPAWRSGSTGSATARPASCGPIAPRPDFYQPDCSGQSDQRGQPGQRGPRQLRGAGRAAGPRYPSRQRGLQRWDAVEPGLRGDPGPARGFTPAAGDTRAGGGPAGGGARRRERASAGAGAAAGGGLLLAALLAGLLLMTGATLVFFGRRSRAGRPPAGRVARRWAGRPVPPTMTARTWST